jgi:23S rRNA A1618 N6-methylase RlmF
MTASYTVQATSREWEGYSADTRWQVLDQRSYVVQYTRTKRDAVAWVKAQEQINAVNAEVALATRRARARSTAAALFAETAAADERFSF